MKQTLPHTFCITVVHSAPKTLFSGWSFLASISNHSTRCLEVTARSQNTANKVTGIKKLWHNTRELSVPARSHLLKLRPQSVSQPRVKSRAATAANQIWGCGHHFHGVTPIAEQHTHTQPGSKHTHRLCYRWCRLNCSGHVQQITFPCGFFFRSHRTDAPRDYCPVRNTRIHQWNAYGWPQLNANGFKELKGEMIRADYIV